MRLVADIHWPLQKPMAVCDIASTLSDFCGGEKLDFPKPITIWNVSALNQ